MFKYNNNANYGYAVIVLIHNTLTLTIYLQLANNYCTPHTPFLQYTN